MTTTTTTTTAQRRAALLAAFAAETRTSTETARAVAAERRRPLDAVSDEEVLAGLLRLRAAVRTAQGGAIPAQREPSD